MRRCVVGLAVAIVAGCTADDGLDPSLFGTWTRIDSREVPEEGHRITYHPDGRFDIAYNGNSFGGTWRRTGDNTVERCQQSSGCTNEIPMAVDGDMMVSEYPVFARAADSTPSGLPGSRWSSTACVLDVANVNHCLYKTVELHADGSALYTETQSDPQAPRLEVTGTWNATPLGAELTFRDSPTMQDYVHVADHLAPAGFRRTVDLR